MVSSIENCLKLYTGRIHGSDERQIQEATGDEIDVIEGASILKSKKKKRRHDNQGQNVH